MNYETESERLLRIYDLLDWEPPGGGAAHAETFAHVLTMMQLQIDNENEGTTIEVAGLVLRKDDDGEFRVYMRVSDL